MTNILPFTLLIILAATTVAAEQTTSPWSLGTDMIRPDGTTFVVELKRGTPNPGGEQKPGVGLKAKGPLFYYAQATTLANRPWDQVENAVNSFYVFDCKNPNEIAALTALLEDWKLWLATEPKYLPSGKIKPGIPVFHGPTQDYDVEYSGSKVLEGDIRLKGREDRKVLSIIAPRALALVIDSIPELLKRRDDAFNQREIQRTTQRQTMEEQLNQKLEAEKTASAQRIKEFEEKEWAKAKLADHKKQLEELAAGEEAKKTEIVRLVTAVREAKIRAFLATSPGRELQKKIAAMSEEINSQYAEETKNITKLEEVLVKSMETAALLQQKNPPQPRLALAALQRASMDFKESDELQRKRKLLAAYRSEFEEGWQKLSDVSVGENTKSK